MAGMADVGRGRRGRRGRRFDWEMRTSAIATGIPLNPPPVETRGIPPNL
jgi:hypothetical protein